MSDKKIIFIALFFAVVLVVGGLIYSGSKIISNPKPSASPESTQTAPLKFGDEKAPVLIEEYTNFLCPACASFALETWPKIEENYVKTGQVKFAFYIFPPLELGRAAFCASQGGKFIQYHDYVFAHQSEIKEEKDVLDFALKVGLDETKFNQCYNSQEAKDAAQNWLANGQGRGVTATPTFFIDGEKVLGAQAYAEFEKIIESKLK